MNNEFLLFKLKNLDILFQQTQIKPQETVDYKMNSPRETFSFDTPVNLEESWMIGLTILQLHNSILNMRENSKFIFQTQGFWVEPDIIDKIETILDTKEYEIEFDEKK